MKKYFVVDCDNPDPDFHDGGSLEERPECRIMRISHRLLEHFPPKLGTNIIIGVTRGNDFSQCEIALQIAIGMINRLLGHNVFKNYCVLSEHTCNVEAGLKSPPNIEDELHILSDRPRTIALFRNKDCWWNKYSKLKKSVGKISKRRNAKRRHNREGRQILHLCRSNCHKGKAYKN